MRTVEYIFGIPSEEGIDAMRMGFPRDTSPSEGTSNRPARSDSGPGSERGLKPEVQ
jgi:hypothetical protein